MPLTDRYMCLGCGRFWRTPHEGIQSQKAWCPYCGDVYNTDNIEPTRPELLFKEYEFNLPCGHTVISDIAGDLRMCCMCAALIPKAVIEPVAEMTQRAWQEEELGRLGL